ncbi:Endonuclease/exonuclease/phosphatase [Abortiporus biennis]|nr:Endonuclease/exonuclease/phosphatase [Abortiporus biennis]
MHLLATSLLVLIHLCIARNHLTPTIADIQGSAFQSPYAGDLVRNVLGIVTAKDRYGFWLLGVEPSSDLRVSNGLRVYSPNVASKTNVGDKVLVSGRVSEYKSNLRPNDLYLTELEGVFDITVVNSNVPFSPVVLTNVPNGNNVTHRQPPLVSLSAFDHGEEMDDGWLSTPNNSSTVENENKELEPEKYGLDFWESLEGMIVTIPGPTAIGFPDRFGSFWVHGNWTVNGKSKRGGLSLTFIDDVPDAHPEAILIGRALDGTKNPKTVMGMGLTSITGIATYQFGYYTILPLSAPSVVSEPSYDVPKANIQPGSRPCEITIGDYNVENMSPRSRHVSVIASHIVNHLNMPDIMFLQEIQDDSGTRDNGVVSANRTLSTLVKAIHQAKLVRDRLLALDIEDTDDYAGFKDEELDYEYIDVPPENNMDGGIPGGNIRVAYLYNPKKVSLIPGVRGTATQANEVVLDTSGSPQLKFNPGRIFPTSSVWEDTRKPLAAAWTTTTGERFFTVNVHLSSKRDSSGAWGDARPPVNGHWERRQGQIQIVSDFVSEIIQTDINASVILSGDMNDFLQTRSVFSPLISSSSPLNDINDVFNIPEEERYTYVYDQNSQEIDHMFVSNAIARRALDTEMGGGIEHVHVNTWAKSIGERASDHDPSVAKVWVCDVASEDDSERALHHAAQDTLLFVVQDAS